MEYRFVCILNNTTSNRNIDIEVCMETGSRSLSPFQRKVNGDDIRRSKTFQTDRLAQILFMVGQEEQPFIFSPVQMVNEELIQVLSNHEWIYQRSGGKNSSLKKIKNIKSILKNFVSSDKIPICKGKLIEGEIYISDIRAWWKKMNLRFRYEDSATLYPICYTSIPIKNDNNDFFYRDKEGEDIFIKSIDSNLDRLYSTLSLDKPDVKVLTELISKGWKLYLPSSKGTYSTASYHRDKNGIEWFSSANEESPDSLNIKDILHAYLNSRNYVESDGNFNLFDSDKIKNLTPEKFIGSLIPNNINIENFYKPIIPLSDSEREKITSIVIENVNVHLKPYQMDGVMWLSQLRKNHRGGLLADDMGLGKTLQTLAYLTTITEENNRFLVICPASLTANWKNEIMKFTPQLLERIEIQSYEAIRIHASEYHKREFDTIIVDEGQMVKNDNTHRHKAIESLNRHYLIILSGTPIENSIDEIWAQFKLIQPETELIYNKIKSLTDTNDRKRVVELSKMFLSPFILRRTKDEVLNLPDMVVENVYIELSKEEREIYSKVRKTFLLAMSDGTSGRLTSIALEGLLRLRQCCVNTSLLPLSLSGKAIIDSSKFNFAIKLIKDFVSQNHKVLLFSQFTSALELLIKHPKLKELNPLILTGETRNRQTLVNTFQNDPSATVMMVSIKAGGTGLNLTAADRVILLDDWWNPAVESQAFARTHRIGQENDVKVYRLVCKDTVEEKILELHKNKEEMSELFNTMNEKLTIEEIKQLFD